MRARNLFIFLLYLFIYALTPVTVSVAVSAQYVSNKFYRHCFRLHQFRDIRFRISKTAANFYIDNNRHNSTLKAPISGHSFRISKTGANFYIGTKSTHSDSQRTNFGTFVFVYQGHEQTFTLITIQHNSTLRAPIDTSRLSAHQFRDIRFCI